ncbi:probable caffeine synthase MTL3 [Mercurialis annua]|uniref:probable caffeine synthase MTL3 n=1 Tax=Mercurialis annua TaxID=3986 RepID=UPI00215E5BE3|nr:probable caffeine synthase MTL3 [Mercurialis annua]
MHHYFAASNRMEVPQVLHMNGGEGQNSYYRNSLFQKKVILKAKPILEESISELCRTNLPKCLKMAELGCSSGPNALLPLWEIIQTIDSACCELNKKPPMLQVFLNDLPGTDFNTIFRLLVPRFQEKLKQEKGGEFGGCFISASPGSFYGRLFPPQSLHLVHSSCSVHWCSQVPEGLVTESGIAMNKGNICVAKTSPESVLKAYLDQFEMDFTTFLKLRSEEIVSRGRMILTITAKNNDNPHCKYGSEFWPLIGTTLSDMAEEGVIEKSMLDSWNIPLYYPSAEEVKSLIQRENSFTISRVEQFVQSWDDNIEDGNTELVFDKWERGKHVANYMRAAAESMVVTRFGDAIIDDLFERLSLKVAHYLENGMGLFNHLVISMTKK